MALRPLSKGSSFRLVALVALVVNICLFSVADVSASTLTDTSIRLNRMQAGASTSFRLVFTTVNSGATSVVINFNGADSTTWTGSSGSVNTTQPVSSASCAAQTGATALPGSLTASGSGSSITISSVTSLSATHAYCVDLTSASAVTLPSAGIYHPTITAGSDSTTVAVDSITNDQIVVNASVPPAFSMALNNNTADSFGDLSVNSVSVASSGHTITVNTNSINGWDIWASSANAGLTSTLAAHTIASTTPGSADTLSAGTEGYMLGVTSITQGSGSGTTTAGNYASNGTTTGSGLDTTNRIVASSDGTANGASITVKELAAISGATAAASDYTDTVTYIGAGMF